MQPFLDASHTFSKFTAVQGAPLAVAVSGGSDSLALLLWAHRQGYSLHVLTVDHGLRPEAAREAAFVGELAAGMGHSHETLTWQVPRGGQGHARAARHRLLARAATGAGASVLLLGHTLDDVIETMRMRAARGVEARWQAGPLPLSTSPVWPEGRKLALARPLLHRRRAGLREELLAENIDWVDDPSNADMRYERARVRAELAANPAREAVARACAPELIRAHLKERYRLGVRLGQIADEVSPDGLISCGLDRTGPDLPRLLPDLVRAAGGHDRPVRRLAIQRALAQLQAQGSRVTLGGAWLQATRQGVILGRAPDGTPSLDRAGLWDGRYERSELARANDPSAFLVRHAMPPGPNWREIISERLRFPGIIYQAVSPPL